MVVRIKYRAILIPLVVYMISGAAVSYFVMASVNGQRGLKAKANYVAEMARLSAELDALKLEHANMERRNAQLRPATLNRDLLEEEARVLLGRVNKNDVVVFLSSPNLN